MPKLDTAALIRALHGGERRALAQAITLIESQRQDHRKAASVVLQNSPPREKTIRIGLSGTPGVGKSTFIEGFGLFLAQLGLKIAVLAVDPSSSRSGGSILGDKTRMEKLARHPNVFIRPSASGTHLGGIARRTRECADLCSAAGADVVLIETVGVGQSETMVAQMCDAFVLLLAPAGGDELQGVKRGIMEVADLVLVNKADGDLKAQAIRTCADYAGALRLMLRRPQDPQGFPKVACVSALHGVGIEQTWADISDLITWRRDHGVLVQNRRAQAVFWFEEELQNILRHHLNTDKTLASKITAVKQKVASAELSPEQAAEKVMNSFLTR